ncbi:MAG: helix-turn-helix domain-containing protein [Deltaproteobacteria bacterium]|jgi:hypothetical protein|nr:helix-turn-helix domain-containing protein [Deltaproteobacteria bacterium]
MAQTANKVITRQRAANIMGIYPRQVGNLVKTYREGSAEDLVHKRGGRPSNRGLPNEPRASELEISPRRIRARITSVGNPVLTSGCFQHYNRRSDNGARFSMFAAV